jgi:hypothetical protein
MYAVPQPVEWTEIRLEDRDRTLAYLRSVTRITPKLWGIRSDLAPRPTYN